MAVADHTQQAWFQGFNDVGEIIFHCPANKLMEIKVCIVNRVLQM